MDGKSEERGDDKEVGEEEKLGKIRMGDWVSRSGGGGMAGGGREDVDAAGCEEEEEEEGKEEVRGREERGEEGV